MARLNFDANTVQPSQPFEVIPAGRYIAQIEQSEMRPTKSGEGAYLWLELSILDGEYAGRKLFDRLNLENPNQQAVEIAQRTLSAICHATGQLAVEDSEQLHYRPMEVTVRVRPGRTENGQTYDQSNEIRGYSAAPGAAPVQQQQAALPIKPPPPNRMPDAGRMTTGSTATPPWRKKA